MKMKKINKPIFQFGNMLGATFWVKLPENFIEILKKKIEEVL